MRQRGRDRRGTSERRDGRVSDVAGLQQRTRSWRCRPRRGCLVSSSGASSGYARVADPMIDPVTLVSRIAPGARVVRVWPLTGGVSAKTLALELEHAAGTREQVVVREVREHAWKDAPGAGVELEYDL